MSIRCFFGFHHRVPNAKGCRCIRCSKCFSLSNDVDHDWDGCKCSNPNCWITRRGPDSFHTWTGCVCTKCGLRKPWRDPSHKYLKCVCSVCGEEDHDWEHVEKILPEATQWHSYETGYATNVSRCRKCGATRETVSGEVWATNDYSWRH
jgi:hypothetical protein